MKTFYQILYNRIATSKVYFNNLPLDKHDLYNTIYPPPQPVAHIYNAIPFCPTAKFLLLLLITSGTNRSPDVCRLSTEIRYNLKSNNVQEFADPLINIYDKAAYKFNTFRAVFTNPFIERLAVAEFVAMFCTVQRT